MEDLACAASPQFAFGLVPDIATLPKVKYLQIEELTTIKNLELRLPAEDVQLDLVNRSTRSFVNGAVDEFGVVAFLWPNACFRDILVTSNVDF